MALITMISDIKSLSTGNTFLIAFLVTFILSALLAVLISFCIKKESLECLVIPICILFIWIYAAFGLSLIAIAVSMITIARNIGENDFKDILS